MVPGAKIFVFSQYNDVLSIGQKMFGEYQEVNMTLDK